MTPTTANMMDIKAYPDTTFHFTEAQLAMLAEFERKNPIKPLPIDEGLHRDVELPIFDVDNFNETETDFVHYMFCLINKNEVLNLNKWRRLVKALQQNDKPSEIIYDAFCYLDRFTGQDNNYQLIDLVKMYIISCEYDCNTKKVVPSFYGLYKIVQYHLKPEDKADFIESLKVLQQQYHNFPKIQQFLFYLFPDELYPTTYAYGELEEDFNKRLTEDMVIRFFAIPDVVAFFYKTKCQTFNEPLLLMYAKYQPDLFLKLISLILNLPSRYKNNLKPLTYSAKFRTQHLALLGQFFKPESLEMLCELSIAGETVVKPLTNWVATYPIYTLSDLVQFLSNTRRTSPEKFLSCRKIKAFIEDTLAQHPEWVAEVRKDLIDPKTVAILEEIMMLIDHKKTIPMTKSTTIKELVKEPKFPIVALKRLPFTPTFEVEYYTDDYRNNQILVNDKAQRNIEDLLANPEKSLFTLYQDEKQANQLQVLKQHYANFDKTQKLACYALLRPSFIISDNYQKALQGDYILNVDDFSNFYFDVDSSQFGFSVPCGYHWFGYEWQPSAIKLLPSTLKKAILLRDFPLQKWGYTDDSYALRKLVNLWHNALITGDSELMDAFFERVVPFVRQDKNKRVKEILYYTLAKINHPKSVDDLLNVYTSKTLKIAFDTFIERFPQTLINEIVYLMFNKELTDHEKSVKKFAKLVFEDLTKTHPNELLATAQAYDQQLDKPVIEAYVRPQIDVQSDTQQKREQSANTVNQYGIPVILLNSDWNSSRKKLNVSSNPDSFPSLIVKATGAKLPFEALENLLKMMMLSDFGKPFALLLPTIQYFTLDSQQALAEALRSKRYPSADYKWYWQASAWLYNDSLAQSVWQSIKNYEAYKGTKSPKIESTQIMILSEQAIVRHQLAKDGIDKEPNQKAGNGALRLLLKLSQKSRPTFRKTAEKELQRYAKALNLTADDLADRIIPTLGLDAHGKREFDYGSRTITMRLDNEMTPIFFDEKGKKFKNLPSATAQDNTAKVAQAQDELKTLKAELKSFKADDVPRIELMMVNQRRIDFSDFEQFFIKNPLILRITYQLIWGVYDKEDNTKLLIPFRVVETGEILDMDDNALTIAQDSVIGLVHPLDLTDEQKGKFWQALQDENIVQPIMQIARPLYHLTDEEKAKQQITRFHNERFDVKGFLGLKNKGWTPYTNDSYVGGFDKKMGGAVWSFAIEGYRVYSHVGYEVQTVRDIKIPEGANAVSISEMIYAVDSMARI